MGVAPSERAEEHHPAVGNAAMVSMAGPSWLAWAPLTAGLAMYFCLRAAAAAKVLVCRWLAMNRLKRWRTEDALHRRYRSLGLRTPVSPALAVAHLAMSMTMVSMLAGR